MAQAPVRVGIMLRHVTAPGGVTVFTKRVVRYLLTHSTDLEFHLLYSDPSQVPVFADLPGKPVVLPTRSRVRWDQVEVPRYAEKNGLSLVFNCKFSVPLSCRVKTLIAIPGRENLAVGHLFPWYDRWYNRLLLPTYCRRATALITHTEIGRQDCEMLGARPENIHVIPHGVDPYLRPASEAQKAALRGKLGLQRKFILYLGGIVPLKNIGNLLRAYKLVAASHDVDLVLAGFKRWSFEQDLKLIEELGLGERAKFIGYVPDEDLAALYSAAECFTLPSWYEGFGIPIVEAMSCACPVVTSTGRHAAPEVAGGAAVLVDPASPQAIADGIRRILDDPALRRDLVARGLVRAAQFDWNTTGEMTLGVIRQLVASPPSKRGPLAALGTAALRGTAHLGAGLTEWIASGFYQA